MDDDHLPWTTFAMINIGTRLSGMTKMEDITKCVEGSGFEMSTIPFLDAMEWVSRMDTYNTGLTEGMRLEA
jgi:hypothetical protein